MVGEQETGTLFRGDLLTQLGDGPAYAGGKLDEKTFTRPGQRGAQ